MSGLAIFGRGVPSPTTVANGGTGANTAAAARANLATGWTWMSQGADGTIPAAVTRYMGFAVANFSATEGPRQYFFSRAGTLRNLRVKTTTAQPGTGTLVITVRINGAATILTLTVAAGAAAGTFTDLVNAPTFAAGDLVSLELVNNAPAAVSAAINAVSFEVE